MTETRALGIDVGTTTTKVSLVAVDTGRVSELRTSAGPTPDDADALVAQVARQCREVMHGDGEAVAAIGVASMAETGVPVGKDGAALTGLLRWDRGPGAPEADRLARNAAELFAATGVRLSAKTPLAAWGWLRRERGDVWQRMACWLGVADLVVHALTGERVTDHTLAGRTGGYRLPAPGGGLPPGFDADLLELVGTTPDLLPRVAAPDAAAGSLCVGAADRLGLPAGIPVVVAGHDHQVAAWAAGVRGPGQVADSLGTAEAVLTVLPALGRPPMAHVAAQGMSLARSAAGDRDALIAGNPGAGAMLRRWLEQVPERRRDDVLAAAARDHAADPAPTGAAVPPYLHGRQTPAPDPSARAGVPPRDWPPSRQARAVVEGICYQARWMIANQAAVGVPPSRVAVIGGDRLPRVWTDLKRATLPWPVSMIRVAEPVATSAGFLALVRASALGPAAETLLTAPTLLQETPSPSGADPHLGAFEAFVASVTGTTR